MTEALTSEARQAAATPRWRSPRFRPSRDTLLGAGTIVALLVIWQLVYSFELMPPWAFPSPIAVVKAFYEGSDVAPKSDGCALGRFCGTISVPSRVVLVQGDVGILIQDLNDLQEGCYTPAPHDT